MQTYHYVLASSKFLLEEEPLQEVIDERHRYYKEKNKEVDFWLIQQPAFVDVASMADIKARCPQPCTAVISTNQQFIQWLKLRLEYVHVGQFDSPTEEIPDALASLASV